MLLLLPLLSVVFVLGFFVVVVRFLFFTFETQRRVIISGERERERENNKWWKIMVTHRRAAR